MNIRRFEEKDRDLYLSMAGAFYASPAVLKPIPRAHMERTFDEMMRSDVYVDGFLMTSDEGEPMGYALISKTFSQEPGGLAVWVEELSVLPAFRGRGVGGDTLRWLEAHYPWARIRLEVEPENERAVELYRRLGYGVLGYMQMYKDRACDVGRG